MTATWFSGLLPNFGTINPFSLVSPGPLSATNRKSALLAGTNCATRERLFPSGLARPMALSFSADVPPRHCHATVSVLISFALPRVGNENGTACKISDFQVRKAQICYSLFHTAISPSSLCAFEKGTNAHGVYHLSHSSIVRVFP